MLTASIHGAPVSDRISSLSNRPNTRHKVTQSRHRNTGPDTVFLSQETLAKGQSLGSKNAVSDTEELPLIAQIPQQADVLKGKPHDDSCRLSKKSLFSTLLEHLFLAELEKSSAHADTANSENTTQENGQPGTNTQARQTALVLEDDKKVAAIKKMLSDLTKGKADLSDLPTLMAATTASGVDNIRRAAGIHPSYASSPADKNEKTHTSSV